MIDGHVFAYDYEDVLALEGVACIEGDLFVSEQFGEIPDLAPLWALQRVEGVLHVGTPDVSVGSLQGLDALSYAGGLLVERAPITDLDGLEALLELGEQGLEVRSWEVFYGDVDGLAGLTIVGGDAILRDTMNLEGLGALESVAGDLWILQNPGLVDLAGLDGLQVVEGRFVLALNEELASISGLNGAAPVGEVHVVSNPLLSTCEVMTWVDSLPPPEHVFVRGNDIGMCTAPDDCSPMEAMAEGGCEVEAATYWDGQQCQTASGCSCVGPDCVAAELWTFYVIGTQCEDAHEHC